MPTNTTFSGPSPFKLIRLTLAGLALLGAVAAQAQWQWVDKDGRKVFSDRPPPADVLEKNILKRPAGRQAAAAAATVGAPDPAVAAAQNAASAAAGNVPKLSQVDKELEEKKKKAADADVAKRKASDEAANKIRAENCTRAKNAKTTLDSGVRIARANANGEREVMEDAARAAEGKRIQAIIDTDCKAASAG